MGQSWEVKSGGTQGFSGQPNGQTMHPTRRGVEIGQVVVVGPSEVVRNPHQSGGGRTELLQQGSDAPCSCVWM